MASHMGVQSFATTRNAQVEIFVEYILEQYCELLEREGFIKEYSIESQKHFESPIASDIWDHFVTFTETGTGKIVELWCQTTCYKGNKTGKPESNKTYEVRETLVEAISLREKQSDQNKIIRTLHVTVGSKKYTYAWFAPAKENTFDLSLYLDLDNVDIFKEISKVFEGVTTEFQLKKNLQKQAAEKTELGILINGTKKQIADWQTKSLMPIQIMADKQYELVKNELKHRQTEIQNSIVRSQGAGLDIKTRANKHVHGAKEKDPLILETVNLLLQKNPFIRHAQKAIIEWDQFSNSVVDICSKANSLSDFISGLWTVKNDNRLLFRRLLLRIGTEEAIHYVQDLNIDGVSEHNLYKGDHSDEQLKKVIEHVAKGIGNFSKEELKDALISNKSKKILKNSIWFEAKNGTDLKPSFDYIVLCLLNEGYRIEKASTLKDKAIGFHSEFSINGEKVNPYTNLKVIINPQDEVVAFLKGKFFRQPEFPRRCKEESYVAFTLKHLLQNGVFSERYSIPFIMFIDMPSDYTPPDYALRRLMAFGWSIAFNKDDVLEIIKS